MESISVQAIEEGMAALDRAIEYWNAISLPNIAGPIESAPKPDHAVIELSGKALRGFLSKIAAMDDECCLTIDQAGISTKVVDPAHVAMVSLKISKAETWTYAADQPTMNVGLDAETMLSYLSSMGKKAQKELVRLEFNGNNLTIDVTGPAGKISFPMVPSDRMPVPKIPKLNLETCAVVEDMTEMAAWIKSIRKMTDNISIQDQDGQLVMSMANDKSHSEKIIQGQFVQRTGKNERSNFPLDYMEKIIKAMPDEKAMITFGKDMPISIISMTTDSEILLAPRITND